ncbi:MAG: PKD domain-containing protein, partial [Planctomycetota bacterium]
MTAKKFCCILAALVIVAMIFGGGCKKKKNVWIPVSENEPPAVGAIPDQNAAYNTLFSFDVGAYVSDDRDPITDLTFAVSMSLGSFTDSTYSCTFVQEGGHIIAFTVTDLDNASTRGMFKVTVGAKPNDPPTVDPITGLQAIEAKPFTLNIATAGNVADDSDDIEDLIFRVTSGDGSFRGSIYTNTFMATGNETINFEIEDTDGATTAGSFDVEVLDAVFADFLADTTFGIDNLTVNFTDGSSGNPDEWAWDLNGDGAIDATTQNATYFYDAPGQYTVSLTVSKAGTSDTWTRTNYILVVPNSANTWYVDGTLGNDSDTGLTWDNAFQTIQFALTTASSGDFVIVADSVYAENYLDFGGKGIYLKSGNGFNSCVIDGTTSGSVFQFVNNEMRDTVIDGFMIGGGADAFGGGIYCEAAAPTIVNCVILFNQAFQGGAIYCYNHSMPLIRDCIFAVNMAESGGAIYCEAFADPEIVDCLFANNEADYGGVIYCLDVCNPDISGSIFEENYASDSGSGDAWGAVLYGEGFCF